MITQSIDFFHNTFADAHKHPTCVRNVLPHVDPGSQILDQQNVLPIPNPRVDCGGNLSAAQVLDASPPPGLEHLVERARFNALAGMVCVKCRRWIFIKDRSYFEQYLVILMWIVSIFIYIYKVVMYLYFSRFFFLLKMEK